MKRRRGPLVVCLAGVGLGLGFVMGPNQAAALSAVPARDSGVGSGVLSTVRYLGGLAGVSVISVWINAGSGTEVLAGHRLCLWIYLAAHAVAESVAYNPTLGPMQAALIAAHHGGGRLESIRAALLVELDDAPVSQLADARLILACVAPDATLERRALVRTGE